MATSTISYGVAQTGGTNVNGTLWSFDRIRNTFSVLHNFNSNVDGRFPLRIVQSDNLLIGIASSGGAGNAGTIWSYDLTTEAFSILHSFTSGVDGGRPLSFALQSPDQLIGTTSQGGTDGFGTIWSFKLSSQEFSALYDFKTGGVGEQHSALAVDGQMIFGANSIGGANGAGQLWLYQVPEPAGLTTAAIASLVLLILPKGSGLAGHQRELSALF